MNERIRERRTFILTSENQVMDDFSFIMYITLIQEERLHLSVTCDTTERFLPSITVKKTLSSYFSV